MIGTPRDNKIENAITIAKETQQLPSKFQRIKIKTHTQQLSTSNKRTQSQRKQQKANQTSPPCRNNKFMTETQMKPQRTTPSKLKNAITNEYRSLTKIIYQIFNSDDKCKPSRTKNIAHTHQLDDFLDHLRRRLV